MKKHLRLVEEAKPRVLIFWPAEEDLGWFQETMANLVGLGYDVINFSDEMPADEIPLRLHLQMISVADAVCLPSTWWTSVAGHQITTVAGWLGVEFLSETGGAIETVSAGAR